MNEPKKALIPKSFRVVPLSPDRVEIVVACDVSELNRAAIDELAEQRDNGTIADLKRILELCQN
jgi:hypothetical protein